MRTVRRLGSFCKPLINYGYAFKDVAEGVRKRDYLLHLRPPAKTPLEVAPERKYPARRWVVERTHAWHNKFRRLLVRWEKKLEHYYAMIDLASVLIIWRLITTAGA